MQHWPLTVTQVLEYAARWHPEQQIVCRTVEGPIVISTYQDLSRRAQLCALALIKLGLRCVSPYELRSCRLASYLFFVSSLRLEKRV